MDTVRPSREEAMQLLLKYNQNESLIKHALTVEAVMLHFADLLNEEDRGKLGIIGLLHDIDFEMYPEQHCIKAVEILKDHKLPDDFIHAVVSHGYGMCK